jgi:uncharacterized membrane protein/protein-disulfide isomerase
MKAYARPVIIVLAAAALAASLASLYVHYQLLRDPAYSSFCDVSETVSCEAVYASSYATVGGVPVAAGGAIWAGLVLILAVSGMGSKDRERAATVAAYVFALSVVGLAAVFYFGYASFVVLQKMCLLCVAVYVTVIGIFLVSASSAGSIGSLPSRLLPDLGRLRRDAMAATLAAVWLAGSVALIALFPREQVATAAEAAPVEAAAPIEALTPAQLTEWEMWLDAQPRVDGALATGGAKVLVMKFNDYQCPACRQTWALYKGIIAKYEASHPDAFRYETRDFPLESECGLGGAHGAACEAAVAVRMAREKGRDRELEQALFDRQSPSMTRDDVKAALQEVAQVGDFDARYQKVLEEVRADAQLGSKLGVTGTPTFFINGIRISSLRPAYFDAAIAHELRKAGAAGPAPGA